MTIDRTNTDWRGLESRVNEALTWEDLDRALHPIAADILKIGATSERQGVVIAQTTVKLQSLDEKTAVMREYMDKVAESFRKFAAELDDANRRIDALQERANTVRWLAGVLFTAASAIGAVVFKAVDLWLAHR